MLWQRLWRKKGRCAISRDRGLRRCLSLLDLTLLGIGSMVGSGIYVLAGVCAKQEAGPAVVLSFLLAGASSLLAALCFAELGSYVTETGSHYTFAYVTLGEIVAFVTGWGMIVGSVTGTAFCARAWAGYLDAFLGDQVHNFTVTHIASWENVGAPISDAPNFLSPIVVIFMSIVVASGANCSSKTISVFTVFNCLILLFIIICGLIFGEAKNWTEPSRGGFFPFGVSGVLTGASTCFFAYVGFDIVALCVEEAKQPAKTIPKAIGISLFVVFLLYSGVAASLTALIPYTDINTEASFPDAFGQRGLDWGRYILSIGPLCGLSTALLTATFYQARLVFAMAEDGLLFSFLTYISPATSVPLYPTLINGVLTAITCVFFDLENLVEFSSIVNLLAYSMVSVSVLVLRYSSAGFGASSSRPRSRASTVEVAGERELELNPAVADHLTNAKDADDSGDNSDPPPGIPGCPHPGIPHPGIPGCPHPHKGDQQPLLSDSEPEAADGPEANPRKNTCRSNQLRLGLKGCRGLTGLCKAANRKNLHLPDLAIIAVILTCLILGVQMEVQKKISEFCCRPLDIYSSPIYYLFDIPS